MIGGIQRVVCRAQLVPCVRLRVADADGRQAHQGARYAGSSFSGLGSHSRHGNAQLDAHKHSLYKLGGAPRKHRLLLQGEEEGIPRRNDEELGKDSRSIHHRGYIRQEDEVPGIVANFVKTIKYLASWLRSSR